jgi:hypothetical protein
MYTINTKVTTKNVIPSEVSKRKKNEAIPVCHAYNPSYLEGRDQKDCDLRSAWAKRSHDSISINKHWAW